MGGCFVSFVYDNFRKQLGRNSEGCNKYESIGRLNKLVKNLRRTNKLKVYGSIILEKRAN